MRRTSERLRVNRKRKREESTATDAVDPPLVERRCARDTRKDKRRRTNKEPPTDEVETDIGRVLFRRRQIDKFKNHPHYTLFKQSVQQTIAEKKHPGSSYRRCQTPDPSVKVSNKRFKGQMLGWRKGIHDAVALWREKHSASDSLSLSSLVGSSGGDSSSSITADNHAQPSPATVDGSIADTKDSSTETKECTDDSQLFECFDCGVKFAEYSELDSHQCSTQSTDQPPASQSASEAGIVFTEQTKKDLSSLASLLAFGE